MAIPPLEATKIWKKIMEFLEGVISLSRLIHTCRNHLHLLPHFFGWLFVATKKTSQSSGKKIWWISKGPSRPSQRKQVSSLHWFFFKRMMKKQTPRFLCPNWFWSCRTQLTIPSFFSFFLHWAWLWFHSFFKHKKIQNLRQTWEVWDKLVGATHVKIRDFGWKTASEWKPIARSVGKRWRCLKLSLESMIFG